MNKCQYCKYKVVDFGELCAKGHDSKFKECGVGCNSFIEKICICEACKKVIGVTESYNEYYCSEKCEADGVEKLEEEKRKFIQEKIELAEKLNEANREIDTLTKMVDIKMLLEKSILDIKSLTEEENDLLVRYTNALDTRGYVYAAMAYLRCYYEI